MSAKKLPNPDELKHLYETLGYSSTKIAEIYGCARGSVCRALRNAGIKTRKPAGENHGMWKGGRIGKGDGYVGIWIPEHPRADHQGYVFEHTLVMAEMIGRLPEGTEQIHHINCDKKDNRPENLYLCSGSKEHKTAHWSIEFLIKELMEMGVVGFKDGRYFIIKS